MSNDLKTKVAVVAVMVPLAVVMVIVLTAVVLLMDGFVMMKLWGWFLTPILNIKAISYIEAMGLVTLIRFVWKNYVFTPKIEDPTQEIIKGVAFVFVAPWFTLLIGYVLKSLM